MAGNMADSQPMVMPPMPALPKDYHLNNFLINISDDITDEDLEALKHLLSGEGGYGKATLENTRTAFQLFTLMKEKRYLERENIIYLQSFLYNIGRRDIAKKCAEFATRKNKLHFIPPTAEPAAGYDFLRCHIAGSLDHFTRVQLEQIRHTVAYLLDCPPHCVLVNGLQPTESLLLTFMVPKMHLESIQSASSEELSLLSYQHINFIYIGNGIDRKIKIPCLGHHVSEIKRIMETNQTLTKDLDHIRAQYVKLKNENEKLHSEVQRLQSVEVDIRTMPKFVQTYQSHPLPTGSPPPYQSIEVQGPRRQVSFASQESHERGSDEALETTALYTMCIKVSGLPENTTKQRLERFFEDRREEGGGPVREVKLDQAHCVAYITFSDSEAVHRVMQNKPLMFDDHYIEISPVKQHDESFTDLHHMVPSDRADTEGAENVILEVRGFNSKTAVTTLEDYFESEKSGGGPDSIVTPIKRKEDVAYVTFKCKAAAERVLQKLQHRVDGSQLTIQRSSEACSLETYPSQNRELQTHPSHYKDRVLVKNINPHSTKDGICNVLSNRTKVNMSSLDYGEDLTTALAFFDGPIDIDALKKACNSKPYDDQYLAIEAVLVTCCVMVENIADITTDDGLEMYFQYKAEGGNIIKIIRDREDHNCIVQFHNPDVVHHVSQAVHMLDGNTLTVHPYYECLGIPASDEDSKFSVPESFIYVPENPIKLHFIKKSHNAAKKLEQQLDKVNAKATISSVSGDTNLDVVCVLTASVKSCYTLARRWKHTAQKTLKYFFEDIRVDECCPLKDIWNDVEESLNKYQERMENSDAVIYLDKHELTVYVIGFGETQKNTFETVNNIILENSEEFNKRESIIEETVYLGPVDMKILRHSQQIKDLQASFTNVTIDTNSEEKEVYIHGLPLEVYKCKSKLLESINLMRCVPVGEFSQHRVDFLKSEAVSSYLQEQFDAKGLDGFIDYGHNGHVVVYAKCESTGVELAHLLKDAVIETPRDLSELSDKLLQSDQLANEIERLEEEYNGMVKVIPIPENHSILTLVVASKDEGEVLEKIEDYLSTNAIIGEYWPLPMAVIQHLQKHKDKDLQSICDRYRKELVDIEYSVCGICVTGTERGVRPAQNEVIAIVKGITQKRFTLKKPNIINLLKSSDGEMCVEKTEQSTKCSVNVYCEGDMEFIEENESIKTSSVTTGQLEVYAQCELAGGQCIQATLCDITEMAVDVVVNSADSGLKLEGGLARILSQKAGQQMQKECKDFMKKKREKLSNGEVFMSSSGSLSCKRVAHAVGPAWQGGDYKEERHLREAIICSLENCDKEGFRSIAIPAISTGVFNYPLDKATLVIAEAVRDYFSKENPDSGIKEVHLCNIKPNVVEAFVTSMEATFSNVTVLQHENSSWKKYKEGVIRTINQHCLSTALKEMEPPDNMNEVDLVFYGESKDKLEEAFQQLQDSIEDYYKTAPVIEEDIIMRFGKKEKADIKALEKEYNVEIIENYRIGRIKVYGLPKDNVQVQGEIYRIVQAFTKSQQIDKDAAYFAEFVQWCFIDESAGEKPVPYDSKMNLKLEKPYRKNEKILLLEYEEESYRVNYAEMKINCEHSDVQQRLLRRVLSNESSSNLPNHWTTMSEGNDVMVVNLSSSSEEFIKVEREFRASLSSSQPAPRILKIERIQNHTLWVQYQTMKECRSTDFPSGKHLERKLWHGTTLEVTESINANGFNSRYCSTNTKAALYGQGVYFATSATTSMRDVYAKPDQYERKRVYQCRVLTGEFTVGKKELTIPPERQSGQFYDSVVDNVDDPQIFVIFRDSQAYPEYLITFQ